VIERRHWYLIAATSMASFVLSSAITYNTFKFMCENYRLEKVADDNGVDAQSNSSGDKEFDCYIEEIKNLDNKHEPMEGKTSFKCGANTYKLIVFRQYAAAPGLGGWLPVTKTMLNLGCSNYNYKVICREEAPIVLGGNNLLAYREMVLSKINDEDTYFLENESTKPQYVKPVEPEVQPEVELKKLKRRF